MTGEPDGAGPIVAGSALRMADRDGDDPARPPLPAGHPASWRAITDGTPLDGAPYDWRDPLRRTHLAR